VSAHETRRVRRSTPPGHGAPWPFRLVRRSVADQAVALVALAVLVALTTAAAVGVPRLVSSLLETDLDRTVTSASPSLRDPAAGVSLAVDTSVSSPDGFFRQVWERLPGELRDARTHMAPALRGVLDDGHVSARAIGVHAGLPPTGEIAEFAASGVPDGPPMATGYRIDAYRGLRADSRLVQGRWPAPATTVGGRSVLEAVVTARTSREMHWKTGEEQQLDQEGSSISARLVGVIEPRTTSSDFWALDPGRSRSFVTYTADMTPTRHGIVFVDPSTWSTIGPQLGGTQVSAWYHLETSSISTATQPPITAGLDHLMADPPTVSTPEGDVRVLRFSSFLPLVFGLADQRAAASGELLSVSATGPIGVALVVVLLATSVVTARRRADRALLRARGAGTRTTVLRSAVETALATAPAALVGWGAALVVLPGAPWTVGLAAGLVGVLLPPVVTAVVAVTEGLVGRGVLAGPFRWVFEVLVVAGAAAAVIAVLRRGPVPSEGSVAAGDPLVLMAPLLVAAVVVVALLRIRPLSVRWTARLVRDRSAAAFIGIAEDARGGTAPAWVLGAVVLATGTGVVAAALLAAAAGATATATGATKGLDTSVLVAGAPSMVIGGLALAAVLTAVAVVITVVAAAPERRRRGGLLRTLGLSGQDRTAVTVWELVPRCVLGVVGGVVAGLAASLVVVPAVVPGSTGVRPDPLIVLLTAAAFGLAASAATVAAVHSDRRRSTLVSDRSAP
jgi:putative ABC transport system permease protein